MKTLKVQDLINAIKKDGIKWYKGGWFTTPTEINNGNIPQYYTEIGAACVMGVGCINTGITPNSLIEASRRVDLGFEDSDAEPWGTEEPIFPNATLATIIDSIIEFNDNEAQSWEEAARFAIDTLTPYSDLELKNVAEYSYNNVVYTEKEIIEFAVAEGQLDFWGPSV